MDSPIIDNKTLVTPQDIMEKYEEALMSQKWENVASLMHDSICVTFSTGTFKGKHEVQQAFEHNFATIRDEQYSVKNLHWVFLGKEVALCIYSFQWQGLMNGQLCSGGGRGTSVLVKETGEWKIIAEHLGPNAS